MGRPSCGTQAKVAWNGAAVLRGGGNEWKNWWVEEQKPLENLENQWMNTNWKIFLMDDKLIDLWFVVENT